MKERKRGREGGRRRERKRKERRGKGEEERGKENEKANTPVPLGETPAVRGSLKAHHPQPHQKHQFLVGLRPKCEGGSIIPSNLWPTCQPHTQMEK